MAYMKLCACSFKDVKNKADSLNAMQMSEIVPSYQKRLGVGWPMRLAGDVLACAVDWCYRYYVRQHRHKPTDVDEFLARFDYYTFLDLYDYMGLRCIRLPPKTERALTITYALAMIEG